MHSTDFHACIVPESLTCTKVLFPTFTIEMFILDVFNTKDDSLRTKVVDDSG